MEQCVCLTVDDGVAHVKLNRPHKMNSLNPSMFKAIADTGARLRSDTSVRAIVLSGEGRAFCAGLDVERIEAIGRGESIIPFADLTKRTHGIANYAQHVVWLWRDMPVPVIAAVHGVAFGGGFQLALGADLRYAAPKTQFGLIEMNWGLVPDMTGMQLMRSLTRDDVVRELVYTGRTFDAEEALAYGFVTQIAENPVAVSLKVARSIASRNPHAIRAAKRLLNIPVNTGALETLTSETEEQRLLLGSENQLEAVRANFESRPPRFSDIGG